MYNTSTGNYVVLTATERRALDAAMAGEVVAITDAARLYESGLLLDPTIDEVESVRRAFRFATGSRYSPHLTIAPTMDCNFGCDYCFESHVRGAMSDQVQAGLVDFAGALLASAGEEPDLSVTWFGGEPLMAMSVISRLSELFLALVDSGQAKSYVADIITNGHGLSATVLERLRRADVRQIQVTIDGPKSIHDSRRYLKASGGGSFDRIVENLRRAVEHFRVVVRVNVDRTNADTIEELFLQLDRTGLLPAVLVDPARVEAFSTDHRAFSAVFTAAEFAAWRSELQEWAAVRGWTLAPTPVGPNLTGVCQVDSINSFVVDPVGQLFKCWAELGTTASPVGTIADRTSWPTKSVGSLATRDPFDDPGCVSCLLLPMCLGGCPKTREIGRTVESSECPPFRHNIGDLVEGRYGMRTTIVNEVATRQVGPD
ncbi:radical SAM protein [Streptomyces sp. NPDC020802]|uniref:radical SAM protein n=1 Tax=Streptomyces sp. NPDC020802 TaxID=3365094 RepID=UPI0037B50A46